MKWIETTKGVSYNNGKPRVRAVAASPLITYIVYTSFGGEFFYYNTRETNGGIDPYNDFGHPFHKCNSIEEGKNICEEHFQKIKDAINSV